MNMKVQITRPNTRIIPLVKWNDYHVWPTVASFRRLIRQDPSLKHVVFRVGKRLLINEKSFFEWLESKKEGE